jgi:hypothetical protein
MPNKWLSRKLLLTLVTDALALFGAFGGYITPEQTAAIIAILNSLYLVANAYEARK